MIKANVDLGGYERFMAEYPNAVDGAVNAFANDYANFVKKSYQNTPPIGKVEKGQKGAGLFQPSAPGEPPAKQTHDLFKSTFASRIVPATWGVYAQKFYARYLEFGTGNLMPRPFMFPAMRSKTLAAKAIKSATYILRKKLLAIAKGGAR